MLILACILAIANAYVIRGFICNFEQQDIQTTSVRLVNLATRASNTEIPSSQGNFTFRDLGDGKYILNLVSTTLEDRADYRLEINSGELAVSRSPFDNSGETIVQYPLNLEAQRRAEFKKPRKARLSDIYTDKMVLLAAGGMLLLQFMPLLWQDMDMEELKELEKQQGLSTAFETAQKIAMGKQ